MMLNWPGLLQHLQQETGQTLHNPSWRSVGGGDINSAYQIQTAGVNWFIKLNRAALLDMFGAEAAGLQELGASGVLQVPQTIAVGCFQQHAYLLLNFIELQPLRGSSQRLFGEQLAQLHSQKKPSFGWQRNNTIGSTPQYNEQYSDWLAFWRQQRLAKQLKFAADKGYTGTLQSQGKKLLAGLNNFFSNYQVQPSLLHGDLWGGNVAADKQGNPVLFDPACYYGDHEADVAMTELFGGFSADFYAAYQAVYPLDSGYAVRKTLYNLYHILNHLNLFGGGYLGQANNMISRLLAELA